MSMNTKTQATHDWMKSLSDDQKQRFALNWRIPHSVFNTACAIKGEHMTLQNIDWYAIHKTRDMGVWSHGGPVIVQ